MFKYYKLLKTIDIRFNIFIIELFLLLTIPKRSHISVALVIDIGQKFIPMPNCFWGVILNMKH